MKVYYTNRNVEIRDTQKRKIEAKFKKVHRILGGKPSTEAHVIFTRQRHLCDAEVTLRALNHTLVVSAAHVDPFVALCAAADKLEKQAVKNKHKMIDVRRPERQRDEPSPATQAAARMTDGAASSASNHSGAKSKKPRIVQSNQILPKPGTVEEAVIQLDERNCDQITFRDAETGGLRVLLRRRDGDLELVDAGS
jgi:putative sigma-54 modulation protein